MLLLTLMLASSIAFAGPETTGKWSDKRNWRGTPVHLVLMPMDSTSIAIGDTADALGSILWWRGRAHHPEFEALEGGIQYWSPRTDVSPDVITGNFHERPIAYAGHDIFCEDGERALGTEGVHADAGESVTLSVPEPSAAATGQQRHWFLEVTGHHEDSRAVPTMLERTDESPTEGRLWLASNQPNPFAGTTLIRFALPRSGEARFRVFDLAGRRVATPLSGWSEAGGHSVDWDGRSASGVRLAAGVDVYRLIFGSA